MAPNISLVAGDRAIQFGYIEHIENLAIGRDRIENGTLNIEIGSLTGGIVNLSAANLQLPPAPRPTPIFLHPRVFPHLIGRKQEIKIALEVQPNSQPVEFYGVAGIGKSVLLRYLAHDPAIADIFADGIVHYHLANYQSASDLLQTLFETFYDCRTPFKATNTQIRHALKGKKALIILDVAEGITPKDIEIIIDHLSDCSFLIGSPERYFWGEGRSTALRGLELNEAIALVAQALGRELSVKEKAEAEKLVTGLEGHPLHILQAVALAQAEQRSLATIAMQGKTGTTKIDWVKQAIASLSRPERWIFSLLAALGANVTIGAEAIAKIVDLPDATAPLATLLQRNLVEGDGDRFQMASSLAKDVQPHLDVSIWMEKATQFFTSWTQQQQNLPDLPDLLLQESDAIMRSLEWLAETGQGLKVVELGRTIEGAFALKGLWGRWEQVLQWMLEAARSSEDQAIEAFELHQMGTRALCLHQLAIAEDYLSRALEIRKAISDRLGIEATKHNLNSPNLILNPPAPQPDRIAPKILSWLEGGLLILMFVTIIFYIYLPKPPLETPIVTTPATSSLPIIPTPTPPRSNLKYLFLDRNIAKVGDIVKGRVVLDAPASANGVSIQIESSDRILAGAVNPIQIKANQQEGSFEFVIPSSLQSEKEKTITITAIYGETKLQKTLIIAPLVTSTVTPAKISQLTLSQNPVTERQATELKILLDSPSNGGAVINLSTDNPSLIKLPPSVTIQAGKNMSDAIAIVIPPVRSVNDASESQKVTITAKYQGESSNIVLEIAPNVIQKAPPNLKSITFDLQTAKASQSVTGKVLLDAPASKDGIVVTLTSNNPYLTHGLENTVTIRGNEMEVPFSFSIPKDINNYPDAKIVVIAQYGKTEVKTDPPLQLLGRINPNTPATIRPDRFKINPRITDFIQPKITPSPIK